MKHIQPSTLSQVLVDIARAGVPHQRTKYVHDALTHRVITSRVVSQTNPYSGDWITEAIASAFEVSPDAVECVETDDGEFYVIDGERVAYVSVG